jgi:hypothetical protein
MLAFTWNVEATQIWYEPGNAGGGTGVSEDFYQIYGTPEGKDILRNAVRGMDSYMISRSMLESHFAYFEQHIAPILISYKLPVSIDTTAITWFGCKTKQEQERALQGEVRTVVRLQKMGLTVKHISLQSILSKPGPKGYCDGDAYGLDARINDVVTYNKFIKKRFDRKIKVGITDALLAKYASGEGDVDPKTAYNKLVYRMNQSGEVLDFVIMDHPYEYLSEGSSIWKIKDIVNMLRFLNIKVGLIVNSKAPSAQFIANSVDYVHQIVAADLGADFILQTSWYKGVTKDVYQLKLTVYFAEVFKGISFYEFCSRQDYRQRHPEIKQNLWTYEHPYTHFNTEGKYNGACAPVL